MRSLQSCSTLELRVTADTVGFSVNFISVKNKKIVLVFAVIIHFSHNTHTHAITLIDTAIVKHGVTGDWHEFNDEKVTPMTEEDVTKALTKSKKNYLFFYSRIN